MAAHFEIRKAVDDRFHFNLVAGNGEIILTSQQYKAKANAKTGISSVRKNAQIAEHFERKQSGGGQPYFVLKAANGQIVGQSQMYATAAAMEKGIEAVRSGAASATVQDPT